ncbi:MAG: hypothetical protein Q9194_004678 [Teloschistes cf. exilis]
MVIKGNNGLTFSFSSNISSDELDAHCLNIELMRQRLRGIGQYKMSSPIQGTNREYQSNFPANANETDLDEYLKIAQKMREKMAAAAHKDTGVPTPSANDALMPRDNPIRRQHAPSRPSNLRVLAKT